MRNYLNIVSDRRSLVENSEVAPPAAEPAQAERQVAEKEAANLQSAIQGLYREHGDPAEAIVLKAFDEFAADLAADPQNAGEAQQNTIRNFRSRIQKIITDAFAKARQDKAEVKEWVGELATTLLAVNGWMLIGAVTLLLLGIGWAVVKEPWKRLMARLRGQRVDETWEPGQPMPKPPSNLQRMIDGEAEVLAGMRSKFENASDEEERLELAGKAKYMCVLMRQFAHTEEERDWVISFAQKVNAILVEFGCEVTT